MKGKPLRNVSPGAKFAVKFVDFTINQVLAYPSSRSGSSGSGSSVEQLDEKCESYEIEKYIMTFCNHPNVTPIRMSVNMGEPRVFKHKDSKDTFIQYDRVYLIMDYAEYGSLLTYLARMKSKVNASERIQWVRQLFSGMN
jgi:hypothetical protein